MGDQMTDRELMQQALDALTYSQGGNTWTGQQCRDSIEALRARLAQPEPIVTGFIRTLVAVHPDGTETWKEEPFYTAPPQREWQSLTDENIEDACWTEVDQRLRSFARAIEAKLKEKNHD
jgi:hypothetical protein